MKDLFLSYCTLDFGLAKCLRDQLNVHGMSVWFDDEQIGTPAEAPYRLSEGLSETLGLIALITSAYMSSEWTNKELQIALLLYRQWSERFPAMTNSVILAVAEPRATLSIFPAEVCSLIDVGKRSKWEEEVSPKRAGDMRRLSVTSLFNTSRAMRRIITTENVTVFPLYTDDLHTSEILLESVIEKWKKTKKHWSDNYADGVPRFESTRYSHLRKIWEWILALKRYGDSAFRYSHLRKIWEWIPALKRYGDSALGTAVNYLDKFRERSSNNIEPSFMRDDIMMKAAKHLWENSDISLVLNEDMIVALQDYVGTPGKITGCDDIGPEKVLAFPHCGNPTDVIIGIAQSSPNGISELENVYRHVRSMNSEINDLFDLSILAAFVVAYDKWYSSLGDFREVERRILKPLIDNTTANSIIQRRK